MQNVPGSSKHANKKRLWNFCVVRKQGYKSCREHRCNESKPSVLSLFALVVHGLRHVLIALLAPTSAVLDSCCSGPAPCCSGDGCCCFDNTCYVPAPHTVAQGTRSCCRQLPETAMRPEKASASPPRPCVGFHWRCWFRTAGAAGVGGWLTPVAPGSEVDRSRSGAT